MIFSGDGVPFDTEEAELKKTMLVGIAGGTSAGKSTFAERVADRIGRERVLVIPESSYYKDRSRLGAEPEAANFDHPDSIDFDLLRSHLTDLVDGKPIACLEYQRDRCVRVDTGEMIEPRRVVLVEGILILAEEKIREFFDLKIFIDADSDLRFIRRLGRDLTEKGMEFDEICTTYLERVKPMHLRFVVPSKRHADIIVPMGGRNKAALELVISRIETALREPVDSD